MIDPRTPVLVGAGQLTHRDGDAAEPVDLLVEAARRAGAPKVLAAVDSVRVARIVSRSYPDPGALVAERLGLDVRETVYAEGGGHLPQVLLNQAADDIRRGRCDAVLVGGAESWRTRRAIKRRGEESGWSTQDPGTEPTRRVGKPLHMTDDDELALGLADPVQVYPLFETALGRLDVAGVADLWARFSDVAVGNEHAAIRDRKTAEEIATVSPRNRMVGYPYRKLMVSNDDVDQAAALLLCSAERADAAGVPRDEWVFLHGASSAEDTPFISTRDDFTRSPAIAAAGAAAFGQAGIGPDDLAFVDLYSCFPSAVQIAAAELGFGLDRPLTITGGLTFAGGPWNNYVSHSVATLVGLLREAPDAFGMCTANGSMLTSHAIGIWSCRPPVAPIAPVVITEPMPSRPSVPDHEGLATVEAYTVMHDRSGDAVQAFVACRTPEGGRALVGATDPSLLADLEATDWCDRTVDVADRRLL